MHLTSCWSAFVSHIKWNGKKKQKNYRTNKMLSNNEQHIYTRMFNLVCKQNEYELVWVHGTISTACIQATHVKIHAWKWVISQIQKKKRRKKKQKRNTSYNKMYLLLHYNLYSCHDINRQSNQLFLFSYTMLLWMCIFSVICLATSCCVVCQQCHLNIVSVYVIYVSLCLWTKFYK